MMTRMTVSPPNRHQRGNVTMVFALSGIALAAMVGGGVEITRVVDGRGKLQAATDAAALAAAGMIEGTSNSTRETMAQKVAVANLRSGGSIDTSSLVIVPDFALSDRVTLAAEAKIETILGRSMFGGFHTIKVSATAQKARATTPAIPGGSPSPTCDAQPAATDAPPQAVSPEVVTTAPGTPSPAGKGCIWALGTGNVNGAITFNSGNQINAPTCQMHVHSTGNDAVFHNWGNDITVDKLYAKGRVNQNKPAGPNFVSFAGTSVLNDPYASGLPQLAEGPCKLGNNWTSYDNANVVLDPGTYCGGINFNSGVRTIRLNPGVYHIKDSWNINGAVVDATGVTLYFPGDANFQLNGNTRLNISAPTSGPTAGLAMYEKYGLGQGTRAIDARGGINIKGIIYFPTKQLNFNSGNNVTSVELQILGRIIHFNDSDFNLSPYTGPLPPGVTLPGAVPGTTTTTPGAPPVSSGSGLLVNGSFELPAINVGTMRAFSIAQGVPGWSTTFRFELNNSRFFGNGGGYGTDGVQFAELEKDLTQSVTLPAGKTYRLEFDYRYGDNGSAQDNRFLANWDDKQLADIQPIQGASGSNDWKRMTFPIRGSGAAVNLTFAQPIGADYDHGAFLDRVRIVEDNSLTPPAAGCPGGLPAPRGVPATPAVPGSPLRLIR